MIKFKAANLPKNGSVWAFWEAGIFLGKSCRKIPWCINGEEGRNNLTTWITLAHSQGVYKIIDKYMTENYIKVIKVCLLSTVIIGIVLRYHGEEVGSDEPAPKSAPIIFFGSAPISFASTSSEGYSHFVTFRKL